MQQLDAALGTPLWYVVHCKWLKEWHTAVALESLLGLTVYLPVVRQRGRGTFGPLPFFPNYLFVHVDLREVAPSQIQAVPGVVRLVSFDTQPQPVATHVIDYIREQVHALDAQGGIPHPFKLGDTVRFKSGPFNGLEATFQGPLKPSERVRVLLEFLGSMRELEVGAEKLERVASASSAQHERRTRGKGRLINTH